MNWLPLLKGTTVSLQIFFLTLLFALPLGLLVAVGRMSRYRFISLPIRIYQLIMRGTPLILQLFFFYFGPYYLFGLTYDRFNAAILGFVLNYAAYFGEIYRGGIASISRGQYEAGKVLGFSKSQTFIKIVLPQVVKRILPPMSNEFMTLTKDTALAQVIAVSELFRAATTASSRLFSTTPLIAAGAIYLAMNIVVEWTFNHVEKRLDYYR